jgi:hypothetical protein
MNTIVEAIEAALILLDDLWLEVGIAVTRDFDRKLAVFRENPLFGVPVAGVAREFAFRGVFRVAEVMSKFAF